MPTSLSVIWIWPMVMAQLEGLDVEHFRFHIADGKTIHLDEEGQSLPDTRAAIGEARVIAWTVLCDLSDRVEDWSDWRINIVSDRGANLYVPFSTLFTARVRIRSWRRQPLRT
jgi:hypothetical protein